MLKPFLNKVVEGQDLTREEMEQAMGILMANTASSSQVGAFLTALRIKGETAAEIEGAAREVLKRMIPLDTGEDPVIDTCGTGGDQGGTFNISTAAALLAAAAGARVVKHGNRAVSSACGSADVLSELGVNIQMEPEQARACLEQTNFCFCFAPAYHPAIRNVAETRREIGLRTIFNIIGPLVNPARLSGQVMGVYDASLMQRLAEVMPQLGRKRAVLVHGEGELDEISLSGNTETYIVAGTKVSRRSISPDVFGLGHCPSKDLRGGDAADNAMIIRKIFARERGPRRDTVVANAAVALYVQGITDDFSQGARLAEEAIDCGRAEQTMENIIEFSGKRGK